MVLADIYSSADESAAAFAVLAAAHGRADLQQLAPGDRVIEKLCMRRTREQYDNEGKYIVRTRKSTSQQELTLDFFTRDGLLNLWRPGVDVMMDFETAHKLLYPTPPVPISLYSVNRGGVWW
jgi:hypothetical protein